MKDRAATIRPAVKLAEPLPSLANFNIANIPPAPITGKLINMEKRAASERVKPMPSAAVIVMPERDVPGISASAWASPMPMAPFHVKSSVVLDCEPRISAIHSTTPKNIKAMAMISGSRSASLKPPNSSAAPSNKTGGVAKIKLSAKTELVLSLRLSKSKNPEIIPATSLRK